MLIHSGCKNKIAFKHDGFEFNDGSKPALNFDKKPRLDKYSNKKIIYLKRGVHDNIVSLFYQVTGRFDDFFNYKGNISEFIRDKYFGVDNLIRFQLLWDELVTNSPLCILPLEYEQLKKNTEAELIKIVEFIDESISINELRSAVEISSFDNMKKLEKGGTFSMPWLKPRNGHPKVRKGLVGGYLGELRREDIDYIDSRILALQGLRCES